MIRYAMSLAALLAAAAAYAQDDAALPGWLAGAWCTDGPASDRTCEYWTPASGGIMLGASITVRGGRAVEFEQLRIATVDGKLAYLASPGGGPAVAFGRVVGDAQSIAFGNDAHDYPQRIRYSRDGEALVAEISLADGSKAMRWTYRRAAP